MDKDVEPWRIAVIEDDDGLRSAILRMLVACNWNASGFPSAEAYLGAGAPGAVDCMVLDLYLPGISGFELLEKLDATGIRIPTILITAQDDSKIRVRAQAVGALFLPKPFTGQLLASTVRECIGQVDATPP